MSMFELFDAAYGSGLYQSIPDGIGGMDILHGGAAVDHLDPDGMLDSQGMGFTAPNAEGGVDVFSEGKKIFHTQPNLMGGTDVYDGDMGLERMTIPNGAGGVDIFGDNMSFEGTATPNLFGGEDLLSFPGNADEILSYADPLLHSQEFRMDPFV